MSVDRVMLVDDDESSVADGIAALLHAHLSGIHFESFRSPGSALDRIKDGFIGVVMTGVRASPMTGMAFLREAWRARPDIPIVVIMAQYRYGLAIEALNAGAYGVLSKPLKHDEFIDIVQSALRTNRLVRVLEANRIVLQRCTQRLRALESLLEPAPGTPTDEPLPRDARMKDQTTDALASPVALLTQEVERAGARLTQSRRELLAAQSKARLQAWLRAGERAEDLVPLSRYLS